MRFIYKGATYEFDSDHIPFDDAIEFEKQAQATIPDLQAAAVPMTSQVIRAMIWHCLHEQDATIKISDLSGLTYADFTFLPEADTLGARVKSLTSQMRTLALQVRSDPEIDRRVGGEIAVAAEQFADRLEALGIPVVEEGAAADPSAPPDPPVADGSNATTRKPRRQSGRGTGSRTSGSGTGISSTSSSG